MQFLAYVLIYPLLWLISILPFKLLYAFSDFVYIIIYRIIGYRKRTVKNNLKLVFPEKSAEEINTITKKFYHHLCDMFLEMIKTLTASKKVLSKHFVITNPEELKRLETLNKSIIMMYGHYASYEWSVVTENYISYKGMGIYKRIANKYFDRLVRHIRSKFNTELIDTKHAIAEVTNHEKQGVRTITAFISDQSPKLNKAHYWTDFMGITVPCFTGAEMVAKNLDMTVAYLKIEKVKRGYYQTEVVTLAENPRDYKNYDITEKFTRVLEQQIRNKPEFYLWTHKRWKHKDQVPDAFKK